MKTSTSIDPNRDLAQTEEWFRDILVKILGWSGAVIVLLAGWTLRAEDEFSLSLCHSSSYTDNSCQRAIALAIGYPLLLGFWVILVGWVREKCPEHATIPSRRAVYSYVTAMTIFSLIVLGLLLD